MAIEDAISIEGTLLMLDNVTPHVAVVVQAIRDGKVISTVLSDKRGRYQFADLKPGQYQVRCYALGKYLYYGKDKSVDASHAASLEVQSGKALDNINFRFAPFKKGTWKSYSYIDGLADDWVLDICCNPDGAMWFGTIGGISRYDGKGFISFTTKDGLVGMYVSVIHSSPDGVMWFGTGGGVSRYDGKGFINFTAEDGLAHNNVHAIHCTPDGVVWFGTKGGVSRYDGKGFVNFTTEDGLAHNRVHDIYRDADGVMWFATQAGVSRYDGKSFVNFTTKDGLAHNSVRAIHYNPDGVMWFGTRGGGVSRYNGKEFTNLTTEDGLISNQVSAIHCDPDGVMWLGTFSGVSRYDGKGFVNFTKEDGLAGSDVNAIHCDPDGGIWFGFGSAYTEGVGVSRYDPNQLVNFTTKDGLASDEAWRIHRDPDGVLWFGTGGGASRYDGKEFDSLTTEDGLLDSDVNFIHRGPDDVMWFGTQNGGAARYDGNEVINFTAKDGLAHNNVRVIHRYPDGVMWFGTEGGVSRYDGREFVNFTAEDGLAHNQVNAIHRDPDGVMWFGTRGGVSRYDGKEMVNFTKRNGLMDNWVMAIYRDFDGAMWFGTFSSGVFRYDGKGFINFTTEDGLAHNRVHDIYRDADGVMWFATAGGVSAYDGVAWTSLDTRDGLPGNDARAIVQDSDAFLWFSTQRGITRYRPSTTPPRACIVSVTTDQIYHDISDIPAFTPGTRVTIEYDSIDFKTLPEKRQYRCRVYETQDTRLKTRDEEPKTGASLESWVLSPESNEPYNPPTRETSFDWIPGEPGTYIFEVQAIDRDLNYSEPARVSLTIEPDPALVSMQAELNYLRSEAGRKYQFESIIGHSAAIMQVRGLMERAIDSGLAELITGETGTGKELVAKAIHHNSPRKDRPLLAMNCGAIPRELLASELFGHHRGAFTGAREDKMGLFEAASGGTVMLDEISEMPDDAQVYLLRVLEERVVQRIGEHISRDVDVRVIAIANKDLMKEVSEGRFREDLYYRLSVFPIHVPPLRERIEDIPLLAEHFLQDIEKELDGFAPDVFDMLQSYSWPGNVRELRNAVHRAAALAEERIQTYHFPPEITRGESLIQDAIASQSSYSDTVNSFQRRFVEQVLRECDGNRHEAARRLKMNRSNLLRLIKRFGIS